MLPNPQIGAPVSPSSPQSLSFQSDPSQRAQFKGFMNNLSVQPAPMPAPMTVPAANVDIFSSIMPIQGFADGGYAEAAYGDSGYGNVSYDDFGGGSGDDDPGDDVMDIGYSSGQVDPGLAMAAQGQGRANFTAGPAPSAQDDIVGGYSLPFSSITTSPGESGATFADTSSMPTISEQAIRDQYSLGRGGFEPTAPAFSQSLVESAVASPKPRPDISSLAASSLFDYDVDLLGLPLDPAREMRGLQQQARAQDYTERLGSAVVNEGFGDTRVTAPSQPMDADETYMAQRSRQDALARELSKAGKTVTVDPVTGNVSEFNRREISPTEFNMFGDVVGVGGPADSTLANLSGIGNAAPLPSVPTPMPRPGTLVDYDDPTQVPSRTVDVPMPMPRPDRGPNMSMASPYDMVSPKIPPQLGELGAMGAGAFPESTVPVVNMPSLQEERVQKAIMDAAGRTTDVKLGSPATTMTSLDQLARRAGGAGINSLPVIGAFGASMAASMYDDIVNKGYIPEYDSRGQIIRTRNPKTGVLGKGSRPEASIDDGDDISPIRFPTETAAPESEAEEIANIIGGLTQEAQEPTTATPAAPSGPTPLGVPLQFGYGQVSSNLNNALSNFFNLLGGK